MELSSKDLLVVLKAFSRANPLPLDATEIHDSVEAAEAYLQSGRAYPGQTIKVLQDGQYCSYVINENEENLEIGPVGAELIKTSVQVVDSLPTSDQEQGVIYIDSTLTGSIWNGSEWQKLFEDMSLVDENGNEVSIQETINNIQETLETKVDASNVYTKEEVDAAITAAVSNIDHLTRQIVDELPQENIKYNVIYMVPDVAGTDNHYTEYMYIAKDDGTSVWEKLGSTSEKVDLSGYYTKDEVNDGFISKSTLGDLGEYNTIVEYVAANAGLHIIEF